MSTTNISFIKWGDYRSQDEKIPDKLELETVNTETFETEYSVNVTVKQKFRENWEERILPLKSHDSNNHQLLQQWNQAKKEGKLESGKRFYIYTYLGLSKNRRAIRRYDLTF